eukprot:7103877-Pyramimonas_sp.AAC.1
MVFARADLSEHVCPALGEVRSTATSASFRMGAGRLARALWDHFGQVLEAGARAGLDGLSRPQP